VDDGEVSSGGNRVVSRGYRGGIKRINKTSRQQSRRKLGNLARSSQARRQTGQKAVAEAGAAGSSGVGASLSRVGRERREKISGCGKGRLGGSWG
jgi:hypothetical protein